MSTPNWMHDDYLFEEEMKKLPKRARKDLLTQVTLDKLLKAHGSETVSAQQLKDAPCSPVKK